MCPIPQTTDPTSVQRLSLGFRHGAQERSKISSHAVTPAAAHREARYMVESHVVKVNCPSEQELEKHNILVLTCIQPLNRQTHIIHMTSAIATYVMCLRSYF